MGARWRGSGHGYYFLLRKSFLTESRKIAHKMSATFFQAARRVENRHAGTGEGIIQMARTLAAASCRRLWHL